MDDFLQNATLAVHDLWTDYDGNELSPERLSELNDILDQFFQR